MKTKPPAPPRTTERPADEKVEAATGKPWDAWFKQLDRWGAQERTHTETAAHLVELGVPGWWAQTIAVHYQRERGLRQKHQQATGFTVTASKTIAAPADAVFDAFVDARKRRRWLPDTTLALRTSQPGRGARFDWDGGPTRLVVSFDEKAPGKTVVAVSHERLATPAEAEATKQAWRERLVRLAAALG
jgi:uncharacterized protein YndB with AHSA1/START domain